LALDLVTPPGEIEEKVGRLRELSLSEEEIEAAAALLGLAVDDGTVFLDSIRVFYSAMLHMITGLCSDRLTVFTWDNADDMDPDSVEVLRKLAAALGDLPFVGILLFRNPLKEAWREVNDVVRRMTITPLAEKDAERFVLSAIGAERASHGLASKLYAATGGNTLRMESYIDELVRSETIRVVGNTAKLARGAEVTHTSVTTLLGAVVNALSDMERTVLEAATVVGSRFNTKVLRTMMKVDANELKSVISALKKKRLLSRVSVAEYAFTTKKLWDVVSENISDERRTELHLALAEAFRPCSRVASNIWPLGSRSISSWGGIRCRRSSSIRAPGRKRRKDTRIARRSISTSGRYSCFEVSRIPNRTALWRSVCLSGSSPSSRTPTRWVSKVSRSRSGLPKG
jgi:hypothetical protein